MRPEKYHSNVRGSNQCLDFMTYHLEHSAVQFLEGQSSAPILASYDGSRSSLSLRISSCPLLKGDTAGVERSNNAHAQITFETGLEPSFIRYPPFEQESLNTSQTREASSLCCMPQVTLDLKSTSHSLLVGTVSITGSGKMSLVTSASEMPYFS